MKRLTNKEINELTKLPDPEYQRYWREELAQRAQVDLGRYKAALWKIAGMNDAPGRGELITVAIQALIDDEENE